MSGTAVLTSGGMDSCVLLAMTAMQGRAWPIYVESGMPWEAAELIALDNFIAASGNTNIAPVTRLALPVRRLYGDDHWTMRADGAPEYNAPDEDVYIPGRNIILITLASIWCSLNGVERISIGSLSGNPFPDATPEFFKSLASACSSGLAHKVSVETPLRGMHKDELLERYGASLPLELTLTCSNPSILEEGSILHCAACNKCRERHEAFVAAGVRDNTDYAKALD